MDQQGTEHTPPAADLHITAKPWGPDPRLLERISHEVLQNPALLEHLKGARYRLLGLAAVDPEPEVKPEGPPQPPTHFRATLYDYTNGRTVHATGSLESPGQLTIADSGVQPLPTREEFDEAARALLAQPEIAGLARQYRLRPYRPMPPLVVTEGPDGRTERTVAVGLIPEGGGDRSEAHEIAAWNLEQSAAVRFARRAPGLTLASGSVCGLPDAGQATAQNVPGQVWITVSQGGTELWSFLAVRPAASSGLRGSGVELRYVNYRGKRVLYRAHVPILNVRYDKDACGPYRDWQNEEGMIHADGADVAPGFRLCPTPAKTILDTGVDTGNFLGVAIYVQGQEVVLVSEMEAGWYRYVSEWRLAADGTIRPRFGFTAVTSSCVCNKHFHHCYWRFDFDIVSAGNNRVREYNNPPILPSGNWHTKKFEIKRFRDPSRQRHWRVENSATGQGYDILPGPHDGVATSSPDWDFPRGDLWVLRYHANEIDDGVNHTGPPCEAKLDAFVNGEPVENQDVVIWYAAHFTHDVTAEPPGEFGHVVGPTLKPIRG
jgi:hypothetical protein